MNPARLLPRGCSTRDGACAAPLFLVMAMAAATLGGCGGKPAAAPEVYTLFDFVTALNGGTSLAEGDTFPHGISAGNLLARPREELFDHQKEFGNDLTPPGLRINLAFAEGKPAAYLTTEIWRGYDEVWVQPMYVLVTAWDGEAPTSHRLVDAKGVPARPIFSVGADSAFYSPYWQVFYAEVPPGTPADKYRSRRDVLDDELPLHAGPGRICAFTPYEQVVLSKPVGATAPQRPVFGDAIGPVPDSAGWLDGREVWVYDFGSNRFTWDADERYVEETPLFILARRDAATGERVPVGLPNVGGSGPLHAGQAAVAPGGKPQFGALWRFYTVLLPATAAVFVPSSLPTLRADVTALGVSVPDVDPAIDARADATDFALRVATDPGCFADAAKFPGGCGFLDSQAAVERLAGASIQHTEITASCPLVTYGGGPVPNP